MPPFILPLAVLIIITGPCDIGGWGRGMFAQSKAPAVFQHYSLQNGIALIFVHNTSFQKAGTLGQSVPKLRHIDVDNIKADPGQAIERYGLPRKQPVRALIQAGF